MVKKISVIFDAIHEEKLEIVFHWLVPQTQTGSTDWNERWWW